MIPFNYSTRTYLWIWRSVCVDCKIGLCFSTYLDIAVSADSSHAQYGMQNHILRRTARHSVQKTLAFPYSGNETGYNDEYILDF